MNAPLLPPELSELGPEELLVNELFFSIQGESTCAGRPCFFIRLAGCHLRCQWCDTEHAFFQGRRSTVGECLARAEEQASDLVEVTGGEPLLQKGAFPLMHELCNRGHEVLLETSAAVPIDRVDPRVRRIVDWKTPGSGETRRNRPEVLGALKSGDELKLVVLDRPDYEWVRGWLEEVMGRFSAIGTTIPVHLSPVFGRLSNSDLADWILADGLPVRLNLQLHKYVWPARARGV